MRKFIVSDLHGNGNVYKSIMYYLENISLNEEVILYINGDLIDRGIDSADMLIDIKNRMISNPFKIVYLGGNHELMMFQTFCKRIKGITTYNDIWFYNGGTITDEGLEEKLSKEKILEIVDFVSNLDIYHLFDEKIDRKNILLVHASYPLKIEDSRNLKIKDNDSMVEYSVWARERDSFYNLGNDNYFSIVGHTPNSNIYGVEYHNEGNYLNIDGGCARYVTGKFSQNHSPLVEVCDGYLKVLTFDNSNNIIFGNYFSKKTFIPIDEKELNKERKFLNNKFKPKKLTFLKDNTIGYE